MTERLVRQLPYDRFRRTVAKRMTESVTTKPQVTLHRSVDLENLETGLAAARKRHPDAGLGFTGALLASISRGLAGSRVNGTVAERTINLHDTVSLGVAVEVDGALVVPVIRAADSRSVADIGTELKRLAEVARSSGLRPQDVADATFTVSSLGPLGVEFFSPIVNPPQLAILGIGSVRKEIALVDDQVVTVRRMWLSLSFDHAATDGADAARALDTVCEAVESPVLAWVDPDFAESASGQSNRVQA